MTYCEMYTLLRNKNFIYIYIYIYIYVCIHARRIIANGITVGGEILRTRPDWPCGPIQSPVLWIPGLSRGSSGRGVVLTTHPNLAPRLKKE